MDNKKPRIAGAGIACIDYIFTSLKPNWGGQALVSDYQIVGGGLIGTAMATCARLQACAFLYTLLGEDPAGRQIEQDLRQEGIVTSCITRQDGASSPFSLIHVDEASGERTIFHRPGKGLDCGPSEVDLSAIRECGALLIDDIYPALSMAAAEVARAAGVPVVADMIPNESNAALLALVDVLIAPSHFARSFGFGNEAAALHRIHNFGPTTAVTQGAKGWICSNDSGVRQNRAFEVEVVDTTGAGDSFHGAFAYGLASGWDALRCGEFASAVAALKCTKPGGRAGLPSLSETLQFLRERAGWR